MDEFYRKPCHFGRDRLRITVNTPNPPIARPAIRFIQSMALSLNRSRKCRAMVARMIHQSMAPKKMPPTKERDCHHGLRPLRCKAANTARKESTVVGLVSVKKNVETVSD